ncbi:hypothetical protein PVW48_15840 [Dinoroseobacter sp. PD6]|uniref:hypothetical protein n=1 Tax=Dinoroseobacter sp. PD6 TaxID=3028384 RepID=UPI00237BB979|nr:hypothetical protein [Dinoroseobacter sp. PD6]MDD9718234.1 hypothetical protein [Dinoroseobacter sp. PD6]
MAKKVLMVGWHPSVVAYGKWPGLTPEKLEAGLRADAAALEAAGYETEIGFIRSGETATDQVATQLRETAYDVVMIGAGVRRDDEHFLVFETLVNVVHEHAPQARIAFNTGPTDSRAAIERWA